MINETYSAFVQGFMPTLARPDVDVLEGLTTAIIVDQERMGANPRSTVGTATDANAMLRILFSRLGKPHIGPPTAFAFNVPTRTASGVKDREGRQGGEAGRPRRGVPGRHVPALRGHGQRQRLRPDRALRRLQVPGRRCADGPRLQHGRLVRPDLQRRRPAHGQADRHVHQEGAPEAPVRRADQDQGGGDQPHLRGPDPQDPEVDALQGRRGDAAPRPPVRGTRDHLHDLPRLRRHQAHPGGPVVEDQGQEHRRAVPDADQRPRRVDARRRRAGRRPLWSPGSSTCSTPSPRSAWATSRSTGPRARCPGARRSGPR